MLRSMHVYLYLQYTLNLPKSRVQIDDRFLLFALMLLQLCRRHIALDIFGFHPSIHNFPANNFQHPGLSGRASMAVLNDA